MILCRRLFSVSAARFLMAASLATALVGCQGARSTGGTGNITTAPVQKGGLNLPRATHVLAPGREAAAFHGHQIAVTGRPEDNREAYILSVDGTETRGTVDQFLAVAGAMSSLWPRFPPSAAFPRAACG